MLSNLFFSLLKINAMATIVAVIVLALKYVLKKCGASRKLLFCLWIIIALRFVYPNFIESNFSLFNIFDNPISEERQITISNNQTNITNTNNFISTEIDFNTDNAITDNMVIDTEINDIQTIIPSESIVKEQSNKLEITEILMLVWIAGSLVMILYALISYLKLKKTVMFAVKGNGDYYETDMISTPCVLGIIRPKIYLTLNLTEKEKKYILTHENTHIKRKDYFTKLIAYIILTIHWVNPISWVLFRMFVNDMEMLCDEESLKKLGKENKVGYMESLVNLSTRNTKNILPCPIAFSENNTEKRVKNMIKYKKSGIIISIVALVICVIIAAICLTNKQEVSNNDDISISIYEQTEQYLESEFNRVYTQYYEILDLEISNWNENYNEATFYYTMTFKNYYKDPDTVDYIKDAKEKGDIKSYEILKKEYLEPKEASYEFKIIIENNEIELYSNAAPKGEHWEAIMIDEYVPTDVNLNEWNSIKNEIVWGKLAYREYQTDNYYTQVIKDKKILEELNDYLFTYTREIKGGTACPFDATINLGTASGKRIEVQLATDSCTVFKIGEQYYEYTEDKGEEDPDEADFYKYFDKIYREINLNVRNLENLKYSTTAQFLLPYASEPAVYKKLEEINNQNWDETKLKWEKIPSNIVSFNDYIFDITMKNQGYFEMVDENDLNFERNISDQKAIEIIKNQYGKIFEKKFDTYTINSNIVLYTDFASQIEKEPVILVTVQGTSKTTEKDKQAVKEFWNEIDKDISEQLDLDEYHWLYIYLLNTMTGKEFHINPHTEMGHVAMHNSYSNIESSDVESSEANSGRKEVYINAIKNLYHNYKLPDGTELEDPKYVDDYNMSENQFAICDVDMDGKEELLIALTHYPMAAMRTIIYDYDSNTNKFREQFTGFNWMNFYNNGSFEVMWSHNQGSAGDSLWPYTLYRYNNEQDSFEVVAEVDAWDKSFSETCYIEEVFPENIDKDGDKIVYYVRNSDSDEYSCYDLNEFNKWKKQYITNETSKITVPYINLTEENINNI